MGEVVRALRRSGHPPDPATAAVGLVSLVVYYLHGFDAYLSRDLSVYTYAGQQVVDGVPPYLGILNRAGPLAHLLPAVGIAAARAGGLDDLFGARLFYLLLAALSVCVVHLVGRDLFASRLAGLAAAFAFLSFSGFIEYASGGPREKTPMVLFMLVALWAMTRRRWFAAGAALSLATLVLQLAFFVGAPALLVCVLAAPGGRRVPALARTVAGGLLPVAAFVVYFAAVGALRDAVEAFVVINARYTTSNPMLPHFHADWALLQEGYGLSLWVLVLGLAALLALAVAALLPTARGSYHAPGRSSLSRPTVAAFGLAAAVGIAWTLHDFDSWPDVFPLLPLAALGVGGAVRVLAERLSWRVATAVVLVWVLAAAADAFAFSTTQRGQTLLAQRRSVAAALRLVPAGATILSINAAQPLVLSGMTNPTRYQMFASGLDDYVDDTWPGGLRGFGEWVLRIRPTLVAVGEPHRPWVRRTLRGDYRAVGEAPGWTWYADRSLGRDTLTRLRRAEAPYAPVDDG